MESLSGKKLKEWRKAHPGQEPPKYGPNIERIAQQSGQFSGPPGCYDGARQPWHGVVENPRKFRKKIGER